MYHVVPGFATHDTTVVVQEFPVPALAAHPPVHEVAHGRSYEKLAVEGEDTWSFARGVSIPTATFPVPSSHQSTLVTVVVFV